MLGGWILEIHTYLNSKGLVAFVYYSTTSLDPEWLCCKHLTRCANVYTSFFSIRLSFPCCHRDQSLDLHRQKKLTRFAFVIVQEGGWLTSTATLILCLFISALASGYLIRVRSTLSSAYPLHVCQRNPTWTTCCNVCAIWLYNNLINPMLRTSMRTLYRPWLMFAATRNSRDAWNTHPCAGQSSRAGST